MAAWQDRIVTVGADRKPQKRDMSSPPMIALPGMTGLVKAMAEGLEIKTGTEAAAVTRHGTGWQISDPDGQPLLCRYGGHSHPCAAGTAHPAAGL